MNKNDGKFYVFQKKEEPQPSKAKLALFLIITLVWVAGMVCMFLRKTDLGIILWGASFLTALVVYFVQRHNASMDEYREASMIADAKPTPDADTEDASDKAEPAEK
ncbi:MAG: hypothetical protein II920_00320 [Clostridia bacterium]|nr:hypothetical protein [Clostridia bacterium]